jgi:hypothetical protein
MLLISKTCEDKIVEFEIGGPAYYNKVAQYANWPGGNSGVTIGIGYDLGYKSMLQLNEDWGALLSVPAMQALRKVLGIKGPAASYLLHTLRPYPVPLDAALQVFKHSTLPKTTNDVDHALDHCEELSQDSLGALVSLVYNRGADFSSGGDRRSEMRFIKQAMATRQFGLIPGYIRSMKRLWSSHTVALAGLLKRRDWEADMFAKGLLESGHVEPRVGGQLELPLPRPVRPKPQDHPYDPRDHMADELMQGELDLLHRSSPQ